MASILTVRAALQALVSEGLTQRNLFQLGSAMGPASLYILSASPDQVEPLVRTDTAGRTWLHAFTTPHPPYFATRSSRDLHYREVNGATLLRLACATDRHLVLDAGSPLECRIPPRAAESLQVAAGYTESLVASTPPAVPEPVPAVRTRPRFDRERLAS